MIYRNVEFPFQVSWGKVQHNIHMDCTFFPSCFRGQSVCHKTGWNSFSARLEAFGSTLPILTNPFWPKKQYKKKSRQKEIPLQMENSKVIDLKKKVLTKHNTHPSMNCFDVLVGMLLTLVVDLEQGIQPVVFLVCFMRARVRHDVECIKKVG